MTEFSLLGPLQAVEAGRPLPLPPGKPSALLARLLLDANRVVPAESLVEALWGESPPASAAKVVQAHISRLRKVLGRERIETRPPGYLLRAGDDQLDLRRFERLVESAAAASSAEQRAGLLREALSLWRGPALAEFREEPFAAPAARRLAELRSSALERRVEAELELGEHAQLVPELEEALAREPLRERLRAALMLALYRSGRQAEALERYREGRRLLVEELGIEPGPALQELERAILRQEPGLLHARTAAQPARRGPVVGAGAVLLPLLAPLCADGRELLLVELATGAAELAALSSGLEAARTERRFVRTACFTSTAPADDLARLAEEQGAELLVVASVEHVPAGADCDVAFVPRPERSFQADGPVLVPFGGGREEWAALELGAWLARANERPLKLLGSEARGDRRDASRTLAGASLALQRFAGVAAEPVLVEPGPAGILGQPAAAIVASLPPDGLDPTRQALAERAEVALFLVRSGLRPGGLAPDRTLTRFSWSLHDEA